MKYYERLRELREKRNLSQKQMASNNFVSQQTISQYESNTRKPPPEMLIQLAEYFGVTIDYLLCLGNNPTPCGKTENLKKK